MVENTSPNMKTRRLHPWIQTDDIPLLQECAFIQHKAEITNYMNELKRKEQEEFNQLKVWYII